MSVPVSFDSRKLTFALAVTTLFSVPASAQQETLSRVVNGMTWREMGPATVGGRIADVDVVEANPSIIYVGTASGGLWKTTGHGASWMPIFDDEATASIGDVTIAPSNPNVIWVGTGEPQNRQSSPWGAGVYRSTDAGRTWTHVGLTETRHIARIRVHPRNPDIAYVAAVGHLWGPNPERGVYQTTDGGETWTQVLSVDDHTGAIDLAMDPQDPQTLFAAMYQRQRTGYGFNGGGPGSGLYRTTDGGTTWTELTDGLPEGTKGRIGLDIYRRDGNVVFAIIEADPRRPGQGFGQRGGPRKSGVFRSLDRGETWEKMSSTNPRPMYYSQIRIDPNNPDRIYVLATQLHVSDDAGRTFRNDGATSIHVDHHALWIDPDDSNHLILGSDGGVSASFDGTQSWRMYDNLPIGQFYNIGVDMRDPYYVCGGLQDNSSWCAPHNTLSRAGIRNQDWYDVWGGDGFYNVPDPNDHTVVFTSSQGGNMGRYDVRTGERQRLRPVVRPTEDDPDRRYRWNWNAPIVVSAHDSHTIYQGGNVLFRSTNRGATWEEASPDLTKGLDRAELEIMGVTPGDGMMSMHDGISSYGNITTIAESPLDRNVLYVGTDDGNVQVTRDGAASWTNVVSRIRDLPDRTYVSRLVASRHDPATVYATFDGHRNDDYAPYVYVSRDFGERWEAIAAGLPDWSVNVIVEHHRDPELLFVGNEIGAYVSIDGGAQWTRLDNNLPTVPVDDIIIHPRANDLILGTHGRSIWILPDVTPLEELSRDVLASASHLFPVQPATTWSMRGGWPFTGANYSAPNPPVGARIRFYLRDAPGEPEPVATGGNGIEQGPNPSDASQDEGGLRLTVLDSSGETVRELAIDAEAGMNEVIWDLRYDRPYRPESPPQGGGGFGGAPQGPPVLPGAYTVRLEAAGQSHTTEVAVRLDPRLDVDRATLLARHEALMDAHRLAKPAYEAGQAVRRLNQQLNSVRDLMRAREDAPAALREEVDTLRNELQELQSDLNSASAGVRVSNAIAGVTARPTDDQRWQIDRAWEEVPALIERINTYVTVRIPALYRSLDEHGIRPDPGEPIALPRRPMR